MPTACRLNICVLVYINSASSQTDHSLPKLHSRVSHRSTSQQIFLFTMRIKLSFANTTISTKLHMCTIRKTGGNADDCIKCKIVLCDFYSTCERNERMKVGNVKPSVSYLSSIYSDLSELYFSSIQINDVSFILVRESFQITNDINKCKEKKIVFKTKWTFSMHKFCHHPNRCCTRK